VELEQWIEPLSKASAQAGENPLSSLPQDRTIRQEARQLRGTCHYFGCEPGQPTYRYDIIDTVQDPEGPFLCLPKIIDCRSDTTTQAHRRVLCPAAGTTHFPGVSENHPQPQLL
jgi:hypothetical protein